MSDELAVPQQFGIGSIFSSFLTRSTNKRAEFVLKIELGFINESSSSQACALMFGSNRLNYICTHRIKYL